MEGSGEVIRKYDEAQDGPRDAQELTACGIAESTPIIIYPDATSPTTGAKKPCDSPTTVLHEIIAHRIGGNGIGHGHGGVTGPGVLVGGKFMFPIMSETECNLVDIKAGKPNYDENGNNTDPQSPGNSPILLDIGGRGAIRTTGADDPVLFDIDAEGLKKTITWSAHGRSQAFLVIDLSGNGAIDDGGELFGTGTFLVDEGVQAEHGFQALAQYDLPARGGNGDGIIDANDAVWSQLRLWSDVNHDGVSHGQEVRTLDRYDVIALELDFIETDDYDAEGNWHRFRGYFHMWTKIQGQWVVTRELMEDIFFQLVE